MCIAAIVAAYLVFKRVKKNDRTIFRTDCKLAGSWLDAKTTKQAAEAKFKTYRGRSAKENLFQKKQALPIGSVLW